MTDENKSTFHTKLHGVTAKWQITDFLNLKLGNGKPLRSPVFQETEEASWQISLYPKGCSKDENEYLSLFLKLHSAKDLPVSADYSLSIKVGDELMDILESIKNFETLTRWGHRKFLERCKLIKALESSPAGTTPAVTIECTVRLPDSSKEIDSTLVPYECPWKQLDNYSFHVKNKKGVKNLTSNFGDLLISKEHCDVKINVGEKCYDAHKAVLSARSTVFSSMFKYEMAENLNGTIDISDCDPESFGVFLEFLYAGKLDKLVYSNSISIYNIADKYCLKDLQEQCVVRLSEGLETELICDILDLAATHEETELLEKATEFFLANATAVFATEKWLNFMTEKTSLANEFLKELAGRSTIKQKVKK